MKEERICAFCGETFVPTSNFQKYCKRPHYMTCPVCGKKYLVTNNENLKRLPVACSYACRAAKTRQTSLEKYGTLAPGNNPEARKKAKATMQRKYGVDYAMESAEIQEKSKSTMIEKYGVDNAMKCDNILKKAKKTNLHRYGSESYLNSEQGKQTYKKIMKEKYGVESPLQNEQIRTKFNATCRKKYNSDWFAGSEIGMKTIKEVVKKKYGVDSVTQLQSTKDKTKATFLRKYGFDNVSKHPDIKKKIKQTMIDRYGVESVMNIPEIRERIMKTSQERYGVPFYIMLDEVKKSSGAISQLNMRFEDKLNNLGITTIHEFQIDSRFYDFYLPDINMLIDLNPTYTHNLIGNHWDKNGKDANYHFERAKTAYEHNMNLRCVFDWDSSSILVEQLVAQKSTLDSTECIPYLLNKHSGINFLKKYGRNRRSQYPRKTLFFGLVNDKEIKQALAISINKTIGNESYAIIDYGTQWGLTIHSGYKKLMEQVINLIDIKDLCLNIEFDRFDVNDIAEFNLDANSIRYLHPVAFWSKKDIRIPCKTIKDDSEFLNEGWLPVEDCGRIQFSFL